VGRLTGLEFIGCTGRRKAVAEIVEENGLSG
jgi:hypothetical protein